MQLIVCGTGNLAEALLRENNNGQKVIHYGEYADSYEDSVGIYLSGEDPSEFLTWCGSRHMPMINASVSMMPCSLPIPVVNVPILALPVEIFLSGLRPFVSRFTGHGLGKGIIESQAKEEGVSSLAREAADAINLPQAEICSVRAECVQEGLHVPYKHLGCHNYIWVKLVGDDIEVCLEMKVDGLKPHVRGALEIARRILANKRELHNGLYSSSNFI